MKKIIGDEHGSFVIDVFLLPFIGIIQTWIMIRYLFKYCDKRNVRVKLTAFVVAIFWSIALGLYYDFFSFRFLADMSGNDFMWNWPLLQIFGERLVSLRFIPTYNWAVIPSLLLFGFLFLFVYPLLYWLGIQVGYILFGRSESQRGAIDLFFPRKMDSRDNFN